MSRSRDPQTLLESLLAAARKEGADAADALLVDNISASVSDRLGRLEDVERSESAIFFRHFHHPKCSSIFH